MIVFCVPIDLGTACSLFVSRSRSPGHEQRFPDEDGVTVGHSLHDEYDGTPSFRSVRDDP